MSTLLDSITSPKLRQVRREDVHNSNKFVKKQNIMMYYKINKCKKKKSAGEVSYINWLER